MDLGEFAVDGLVSAAQARALGVDWNALRRCVASGTLHRVIPGWYAVEPPASPAARHVLEARAWVRHFRGRALASHHSAVLLHGLPTLGVDVARVHLTRTTDRHTRDATHARPGRGATRGRPARLAHVFRGLGIVATPQVWVRGLRDWRVDFLVDGTRVVVEFDGAVKYAGPTGRDALMAEKRREDALRELGFEVVRVTWADLAQPQVIGAWVRAAVARAARHTA